MKSFFQRARLKLSKSYKTVVHKNGEQAMDTMLGSMVGVLFLALLTSSFVGVFISYNILNTKAKVNSQYFSMVNTENANSLNNYLIDLPGTAGYTAAVNSVNNWTVAVHPAHTTAAKRGTLGSVLGASNINSKYVDYTFAAQKTVNGRVISQWGKLQTTGPENGMLTMYTATPKAGRDGDANVKCDWREKDATKFQNNCLVSYQTVPSVVSPPEAYTIQTGVNWEENVRQSKWTTSPDYSTGDLRNVKTTTAKIGTINLTQSANGVPLVVAGGNRTVQVVVKFDGLKDGQQVAIDLKKGGDSALYSTKVLEVTKSPTEGSTGLTRTMTFPLTIPQATTTLDVFMDTDRLQTNDTLDATIQVSRFMIYQTIPTV